MTKFKDLLNLTKSEIVLLEAITLAAGYFIGQSTESPLDWQRFLFTLIGVSALALGSGALNQIQECDEDSQMDRTKNRPLPSGRISLPLAWSTTLFLFTLGILLLSWVSIPVLVLGIFAVISYNGL